MKNPLNLKYNNLFYSNQQSYKLNLYKIFNLSLMLIIKINIIKHNNILKLKELFNKTTIKVNIIQTSLKILIKAKKLIQKLILIKF